MGIAKQNALNLYKEGILEGNARAAVEKYTGGRYTQHSTGVEDGVEGFVTFFEPFLERNPVRDFQFVRALQDGRFVFLHAFQDINNGDAHWITTDFFETDADAKIVEHWDVIAAPVGENKSGHNQIDGPTDIKDLERTDSNREVVQALFAECLIGRKFERLSEYVSAESFVQHTADGTDGLENYSRQISANEGGIQYHECFLTVAEGNFVATLNKATKDGQELCQVDLFRLEDGLIVEHWDNAEPVPPRSEWTNNGKF